MNKRVPTRHYNNISWYCIQITILAYYITPSKPQSADIDNRIICSLFGLPYKTLNAEPKPAIVPITKKGSYCELEVPFHFGGNTTLKSF